MDTIVQLPLLDGVAPPDPTTKRCATCKAVLARSSFSRNPNNTDGQSYDCRQCVRRHNKLYYSRVGHTKHIERKYGISRDDFIAMLNEQGNACAICRSPQHGGKNWHVDHDHTTGINRGILCSGCNLGIGGMRDNPETLIAAAAYLRKYGK